MLTRVFDDRYAYVRLALLALSGIGYLVLLSPRRERLTAVDWALDGAALALCAVCARWPFAGALAQTAVLGTAFLVATADPVVPEVGASWAVLELALRAPGWRLVTGVAALAAVYLADEADRLPRGALAVLFNFAIVIGVPALLGANIRASRQLARQAEERAATEQRRRLSETRAARAGERTAIARELHDVVAHHVASIVLRVGVARHVLPTADPRVREVLDDVHATGSAALADLRQLVTVLRDPAAIHADPGVVSIEPEALPAALRAAVDRARQTGVTVEADIDPALSTLDAVRGLAVLRLTQEGLTNVARHAGPSARARLSVAMRDGAVDWEITDNGGASGRPATTRGTGHGITGMRERVEVLGGQLEAGPVTSGRGWQLRTSLPGRMARQP